jgi:hypothetical protein
MRKHTAQKWPRARQTEESAPAGGSANSAVEASELIGEASSESETKSFTADSAGQARSAASEWLSDFAAHGPLQIKKIRTEIFCDEFSLEDDLLRTKPVERFITTVTYRPMSPAQSL